jgi:hypothetical protein
MHARSVGVEAGHVEGTLVVVESRLLRERESKREREQERARAPWSWSKADCALLKANFICITPHLTQNQNHKCMRPLKRKKGDEKKLERWREAAVWCSNIQQL